MLIQALIVDDEPLARERIALMLETESDIKIVGRCGDGKSAARAIKSKAPDLVFLDIQLPEMDGFEIIESIPANRLPLIVFVTAYDQFALKAFKVHAVDYLLKPVESERLAEALDHARSRMHLRDPSHHARLVELLRVLDSHRGRT